MPRFLIYNSVIKIKALRSLSAPAVRRQFPYFAGCRAADLLQRFFERYFYHRLRIDLIRSDLEIRETRIQVIVEADNGNVLRHGDAAFSSSSIRRPAVRSQLQTNASGICSGR